MNLKLCPEIIQQNFDSKNSFAFYTAKFLEIKNVRYLFED